MRAVAVERLMRMRVMVMMMRMMMIRMMDGWSVQMDEFGGDNFTLDAHHRHQGGV